MLLEGGFYVTADGNYAGGDFMDPAYSTALAKFTPPPHEPTSEKLEQLDHKFANALACGDDVARRGVEEVLWHRAVKSVEDDAMRVALHVRGFETQWVIGRNGAWPVWEEPVREFLMDHWAFDVIAGELFAAAFDIRHRQDLAPNPARLRAADADITKPVGGLNISTNLNAVLRWAPQVASDFRAGIVAAPAAEGGRPSSAHWEERPSVVE